MAECFNSPITVSKPNGTVCLCLDPMRLNQALIWMSQGDPTFNYILPVITNVHSMTITDTSSGNHSLKSSYLTTFHVNLAITGFIRLPSGVATADDMFQQKMDKIVKYPPNVFSIADNIPIEGYDTDGRDHKRTLVTNTTDILLRNF